MSLVLNYPSQRNSAGDTDALMIDKFTGDVQMVYKKSSIMDQYVDVIDIKGTNTASSRALGDTTVSALVPGEAPAGTQIDSNDVIVQVKVPLVARTIIPLLDDFQDNIKTREKVAGIQGRKLGEEFDKVILAMAVNSALQLSGPVSDMGAGDSETLSSAGDELDPDKIYTAVKALAVAKDEKEIPEEDRVLFVLPKVYYALVDNDKLLSTDYSDGNGNVAKAMVLKALNMRIVKTNRLPQVANAAHPMGSAYNVTATMAKTVALLYRQDCIMVGQTIPMNSDIFFDKLTKCHYVDTLFAIGANVYRPEDAGVVLSA